MPLPLDRRMTMRSDCIVVGRTSRRTDALARRMQSRASERNARRRPVGQVGWFETGATHSSENKQSAINHTK